MILNPPTAQCIVVQKGDFFMKKAFKYLLALLVCTCIVVASFCFFICEAEKDYAYTDLSEKELMLVNDMYRLPQDYSPELTILSNGEKVASSMYPYLQKMFDDMREDEVYPTVRSGYRSYGEQQNILENKISQYIKEGLSAKKAKQAALNFVAKPGASEHQTGLAVDINCENGKSTSDEVYSWLKNNAHKYGFICRYPENKTHITGIADEPWHYRFVGKTAAKEMYDKNLCLEEYLN